MSNSFKSQTPFLNRGLPGAEFFMLDETTISKDSIEYTHPAPVVKLSSHASKKLLMPKVSVTEVAGDLQLGSFLDLQSMLNLILNQIKQDPTGVPVDLQYAIIKFDHVSPRRVSDHIKEKLEPSKAEFETAIMRTCEELLLDGLDQAASSSNEWSMNLYARQLQLFQIEGFTSEPLMQIRTLLTKPCSTDEIVQIKLYIQSIREGLSKKWDETDL
ncbi:MAG TPA: hypothetical protein VGJ00_03825 [Rhabdochlamydiaceae bacterium]|jgi:hypothetical protein